MIFKDREDAGLRLAKKLAYLRGENPVILAIPRGGVVTANVVAQELGGNLDIIVSRKIGAPENRELAIGAVMHDGTFIPNEQIIRFLKIPKDYIDSEIKSELREIERRLKIFRGSTNYDLKNKVVVLIDDGIATGATMFAALDWVKKEEPKRLIVAIPVGPRETIDKLSKVAEVVILEMPEIFNAVGEFYREFEQVDDSQVTEILSRYRSESYRDR